MEAVLAGAGALAATGLFLALRQLYLSKGYANCYDIHQSEIEAAYSPPSPPPPPPPSPTPSATPPGSLPPLFPNSTGTTRRPIAAT